MAACHKTTVISTLMHELTLQVNTLAKTVLVKSKKPNRNVAALAQQQAADIAALILFSRFMLTTDPSTPLSYPKVFTSQV